MRAVEMRQVVHVLVGLDDGHSRDEERERQGVQQGVGALAQGFRLGRAGRLQNQDGL
jgi:hypothetical protein